eukprot:TRINITY_DN37102_c0_g1_i1.p1 TRINITY_DN37102_c0_g1~~TRINITY_DN37102_c0_g1_i1.p1  ORF type:complete len:411 (+),score=67.24 TRINITY_DN37102_c0_g1_i1:56-1234(+)
MMRRSTPRLLAITVNDSRFPLIKKWRAPVQEKIHQHPRLDEPIVAEFNKGTFLFCNERYPSIERVVDQYFPGFLPRTREDYDLEAEKNPYFSVEELMLENIGLWNVTMLLREYWAMNYTGAKLSSPLEWEVAGLHEYLPKYYKSLRKIYSFFFRNFYSLLECETVMASPKYKIGGIVPSMMHLTEMQGRKIVIFYPVCHNDFSNYPAVGEQRYAQQPLDYLLYSHLNYYHVMLNMYKAVLVQEGHVEANDIVSMALVNFSLNSNGEVTNKMYVIETDDRVREALELRFSGTGPAADVLHKEWFERKDLHREESIDTAAVRNDIESRNAERESNLGFEKWAEDLKDKDDIFNLYLQQQARELQEDRKSIIWRIKNRIWNKIGGDGPLTRDMRD